MLRKTQCRLIMLSLNSKAFALWSNSSVKTPLQYLRVGSEVEFSLEVRNDKVCAENVMLLPPGTLIKEVFYHFKVYCYDDVFM